MSGEFLPGAAVLVLSDDGEIVAEQRVKSVTPAGRRVRLENGLDFTLKWLDHRSQSDGSRIVLDTEGNRAIAEKRRVENAERKERERLRVEEAALRRRLSEAIFGATAEQVAEVARVLDAGQGQEAER